MLVQLGLLDKVWSIITVNLSFSPGVAMSVLNDHDWEQIGRDFKSADPFPSICIDNFLKPEFANLLAASYPDYLNAKNIGREFSSVNEKLKVQVTDPAIFPDPVSKLCETLGSEEFLQTLSKVSGIQNLKWDPNFTGGGMHITRPAGILDVHVDFNFEKKLNLYRRLNILIYLNPVWEQDWGGEVELWDREVKGCKQAFLPLLNRCVLFATSDFSFHGVTAVKAPDGITRNSLAAYYYTEDAGDNAGEVWGGNHSTIFRARPSEKGKKYLSMPLERIKRKCQRWLGKIKSKLKN